MDDTIDVIDVKLEKARNEIEEYRSHRDIITTLIGLSVAFFGVSVYSWITVLFTNENTIELAKNQITYQIALLVIVLLFLVIFWFSIDRKLTTWKAIQNELISKKKDLLYAKIKKK